MAENLFPHLKWDQLWAATLETLYMTALSGVATFVLGIVLGLALFLTARGGLFHNRTVYSVISIVVNVFRSIPFIILIVLLIPFTKTVVGTILGANAALPALIVGAAPFYARLVEIALREVDKGVIEATRSMGARLSTLVFRVLLPESSPALVSGITVTLIALVSYSAMAGVIGAGGLGNLAYLEGFQRNHGDVTGTIIMKKTLTLIAAATLSALSFASWADTLTVGASNTPHAEILEQAKPILAKQGIDLEIKPFQDYILPNTALAGHDIDANYFQHIPYLNSVLKDHEGDKDYDFVSAGAIHIEPIGIYSKKYKSLKDLPEGGKIIMRDAVSEEGRILSIFEKEGVIKLKPGIDKVTARISDIVENPKKLQFTPNVEASLLPQMYNNDEGAAVVINANYAIDAGLDPVHDPIAVESGENNPYANIITVHRGDEKKKDIVALVNVLHSKEIQDWIRTKYKGAVIPVNN